jgi:hypothetical protein
MTQTRTASATATYTVLDIEKVVRRVKADLVMIADSTGGWTSDETLRYAHDVELLAKEGYLKYVDVTLLSNGIEVKAVRFDVDIDAGGLTCSRPGGVLWPRVAAAELRIVIGYTSDYTTVARDAMKTKLKVNWKASTADTSHSALNRAGGRDYTSNAYGMPRRDWAA